MTATCTRGIAQKIKWIVLALFILTISSSTGYATSSRTENFIIKAETQADADEFSKVAEEKRKEVSKAWFGVEAAKWPTECVINIKIADKVNAKTDLFYTPSGVSQEVHIEGPRNLITRTIIAHEITHIFLAHYFKRVVPKWFDEGGSILAEDKVEQNNFDGMVIRLLNNGEAYELNHLFSLRQYPKDIGTLYAEGYSVVKFLLTQGDRKKLLKFVEVGMNKGWEASCKDVYKFDSVKDLQEKWIKNLKEGKK